MGEAIEYTSLKRNGIDISCVFYRMSHLGAIEIFSNGPFIMLEIDSGWSEKLTRFFLADC